MKDFLQPSEDEAKEYLPRYKMLYAAVIIATLLITGRLWFLQIIQGTELRQFSEKNRVKETKLPAPRGLFLDRENRVLVDNLPGFGASISPQYAKRLEETAEVVGEILEMPGRRIVDEVRKSKRRDGPFRPVRIKDNISLDEVFRLKLLRWDHPGLNINESILRFYNLAENGAQLFGYTGEISREQLPRFNEKHQGQFTFEQGDIIGKSGLEEEWDMTIRGRDGISYVEVDARGREAPSETPTYFGFKPQPAIPGQNLVLTIDKDIQEAAYKAMNRQDHIGPRIGGVVVMKSTGEILAWVTSPSYDPNTFSTGIPTQIWTRLVNDPFRPLRNKVIQDHFSPGSTFKPIVALAALSEKAVTPNTYVYAPSSLKFGRRIYHDHSRTGFGNINVMQALEVSSNIFFYRMGIALGIDRIAPYARLLGLGQRTNINLGHEVSGLVPSSAWKLKKLGEEWQPGENLSNAIGQGFVLVTALQMAVAYNTIALEGKVMKPYLIKRILNQESKVVKEFEPEVLRDATKPNEYEVTIEPSAFKTVKEGMRRVVEGARGTARRYKLDGVEMAGKTGTTQVRSFSADEIYNRCDLRPVHQRHHGWFVAFAPVVNTEITVAVLAQHSCAGSSGGGPVAHDIMKAYFEKYHPEMLKANAEKKARPVPVAMPTTWEEEAE
ncbi:MAG: penicillin-binding protein 2 [Bdellovibrionales bacterium]